MYQSSCIERPGRVTFSRLPLPVPDWNELRIRVEGCGVCGSNLPIWQGKPWFTYPCPPGRPGHEGWGVVEAIGDAVEHFEVGDRVTFLGQHSFAEVDLVPAALAVKLPPQLDGMPFPGEALGCAYNVFRRSDIQTGQKVAVIGIGFLGALLVQLAARAGAEVYAISRRTSALAAGLSAGARDVIPMDDHESIIDAIGLLTGGEGCARVIECTGFQWPLDLAGEMTAERGRLVVAGYHQDGVRQVNLQQWNWKGLDVINAHERDPAVYVQGMRDAVTAVTEGAFDPRPLFTNSYPLSRLDQAFTALETREAGFLKALVMP